MLFESGIRNRRVEFAVESTEGEAPSDPSWELFSDRMINVDWAPGVDYAVDDEVGSVDPGGIERGPEEHEATIGYRLQRGIVDGAGDPLDASGYGVLRGDDGELQGQTHTVVDREDRSSGGDDGAGVRLYGVGLGGFIEEVTYTLDAETGEPVPAEISYTFEKIRSYAIHQPSSSTLLAIESTDSGDTSQTLTVEDEGASTSEDVSLNGTTVVSTTNQYGDIDALHLDAETVGNVNVYVNSGSETSPTKGTLLATIRGSNEYEDVEGDLGVPALGTGSHASAIGTSFEKFLAHKIDRGGSALATDIVSAEINISNGVETSGRAGTYRRRIVAGRREVTMTASLVSELRSHDALEDHLRTVKSDVVWTADWGTLTLKSAVLEEVGNRAITPDEILLQHESSFRAEGGVTAASS